MLRALLPRAHQRFLSLPVLGPIADGLDDWLAAHGYTLNSRKIAMRTLPRVDADLRRRAADVASLSHATLDACWRDLHKIFHNRMGIVRELERYLTKAGLIPAGGSETAGTCALNLQYADHLREVRGLVDSTVKCRQHTAECFLQHLEEAGAGVESLQASHIESYVAKAATRLSRASLKQEIGSVRSFLRFLVADGRMPAGLDQQVDAPRVYRLERLPRALPWDTIRNLLQSVDTSSPAGLRNYVMFLLIATYGLRPGEVVAINLDDIRWREGILRIPQRKNGSFAELPLTNEVLSALVKHLKRTPPPAPFRRVFMRMHAPMGVLKNSAVGSAFTALVRKSGLSIPRLRGGPYCLRHSYAVHLVKTGTPFKTIGDILGHRSPEATTMYLRLATEDLREVALGVPGARAGKEGQ
jgi:integrase/recombinase XerD